MVQYRWVQDALVSSLFTSRVSTGTIHLEQTPKTPTTDVRKPPRHNGSVQSISGSRKTLTSHSSTGFSSAGVTGMDKVMMANSMFRHFINSQSRSTETRTPWVSHLHRSSVWNSDRLEQVDTEAEQLDTHLYTLQSNVPLKWQSSQCSYAEKHIDKPIATFAPGLGYIVTGVDKPPQNGNKSKTIVSWFNVFVELRLL